MNAAKFVAAATTNCVDGLNAAAGCALGALNFVSAITGTGSVVSALADGACSDLGPRSKAADEARVNVKIRKAKLIKSKLARRLLREKKLTGAAVAQASKFIEEEETSRNQPDATLEELFPNSFNKTEQLRDSVMSHLRSLKSSPLTQARGPRGGRACYVQQGSTMWRVVCKDGLYLGIITNKNGYINL